MVEQENNQKKIIYLCGPTVYSDVHVGNLRPIITFDIFLRALTFLKQDFVFIHNITDIDDKIVQRALETKISELEVTNTYTKKYFEILSLANVQKPTFCPKVTSNMEMIVTFIDKMVQKGFAYVQNGEVYFQINKAKDYGVLSNRQNNQEEKKDFVLWKNVSNGISFDSPWSKGRPGWHTECAAFVDHFAKGKSLTIHSGGIDLIFPHHENENVQYLAVNNCSIAKSWLHVGKLNFKGQKMSKSLKNVVLAKDFFEKYDSNILRLIFLNSSIKSPLDLKNTLIEQSISLFKKMKKTFFAFNLTKQDNKKNHLPKLKIDFLKEFALEISKFHFAKAMKLFHLQWKKFNISKNYVDGFTFVKMIKIMGFNTSKWVLSQEDKQKYWKWKQEVKSKNFQVADNIKRELLKKEII